MKNLADLNTRKEMLKKDISEIEDKLTFKNPKESFSALTEGFTDQFLTDRIDENGIHKIGLQAKNILSFITGGLSDHFIETKVNEQGKEKIALKTENLVGKIADNALQLGLASIITGYVKKSLFHRKWRRRLIGLAIIHFAPFLLKFLRQKLDEFQQKEVLESLNKII